MRHALVSVLFVLFVLLVPQSALAKSHLWKFDEVFSNADGSVQFIEMFVSDPAGTAEIFLQGNHLESNTKLFIFPNNLPMQNTFQRWILIATPAFAALPGAPTPDFVIPPQFFDPAGDDLRYRTAVDLLLLPAGAVPIDGIHSYLRNGTTAVNSPTNFAGATFSINASRPCADGIDNDGDGLVDYPADPGCFDANALSETSQCQDGIDNDGQTGTDFDGGASIHGPGGVDPAGPDPDCMGAPWRNSEAPTASCGLGLELTLALVGLDVARRRLRARAKAGDAGRSG